MQEDEHILIEAIRSGDEEAFRKLYDAFFQRLFRFAWHMTRSSHAAEDLVHDVFLNIWRIRAQWNPDISLSAYLFRATKNRVLNHQRNRRSSALEGELTAEDRVDTAFEEQERLELIKRCVDGLPPGCRTIFVMSRYDGLKYKHIAENLDVSIKTVENQMGRALRKLRECLKKLLED